MRSKRSHLPFLVKGRVIVVTNHLSDLSLGIKSSWRLQGSTGARLLSMRAHRRSSQAQAEVDEVFDIVFGIKTRNFPRCDFLPLPVPYMFHLAWAPPWTQVVEELARMTDALGREVNLEILQV